MHRYFRHLQTIWYAFQFSKRRQTGLADLNFHILKMFTLLVGSMQNSERYATTDK